MGRIARHVRVTGRVQGVFYRASTVDKAQELGVFGWVRNCPDGTVEAHVEGDEPQVLALLDWMGQGPPAAEVARVETGEADDEGARDFSVRT